MLQATVGTHCSEGTNHCEAVCCTAPVMSTHVAYRRKRKSNDIVLLFYGVPWWSSSRSFDSLSAMRWRFLLCQSDTTQMSRAALRWISQDPSLATLPISRIGLPERRICTPC